MHGTPMVSLRLKRTFCGASSRVEAAGTNCIASTAQLLPPPPPCSQRRHEPSAISPLPFADCRKRPTKEAAACPNKTLIKMKPQNDVCSDQQPHKKRYRGFFWREN